MPNGSSRRHTSSVTVAVLGEADTGGGEVHEDDVEMTTYRASGAGGQHRNVTDSAVRLHHRPSGIIVTASSSRSQWENRLDANAELSRRIRAAAASAAQAKLNLERAAQTSTRERPARTWTWNEKSGQVTDHATGERWPIDRFRAGKANLNR